jgi:hypothetical protein
MRDGISVEEESGSSEGVGVCFGDDAKDERPVARSVERRTLKGPRALWNRTKASDTLEGGVVVALFVTRITLSHESAVMRKFATRLLIGPHENSISRVVIKGKGEKF